MSLNLRVSTKIFVVSLISFSLLAACGKTRNSKKRLTRTDRKEFSDKTRRAAEEKAAAEKAAAEKAAADAKAKNNGDTTPTTTPAKITTPEELSKNRSELVQALGDEGLSLLAKVAAGGDLISKIGALSLDMMESPETRILSVSFSLSAKAAGDKPSYYRTSYKYFNADKKPLTMELLNKGIELKGTVSLDAKGERTEESQASFNHFDSIFSSVKLRKIEIKDIGPHVIATLENKSGGALAYLFKPNRGQSSLELVQIVGHEGKEQERLERMAKFSKVYSVQISKIAMGISPVLSAQKSTAGQIDSDKALAGLLQNEKAFLNESSSKIYSGFESITTSLLISTIENKLDEKFNEKTSALIDALRVTSETLNKKIIPELEGKAANIPAESKENFEKIKNNLLYILQEIKLDGITEAHKALSGAEGNK